MRFGVIAITAALVLIAAFLLLRGGSPETAGRRGAASPVAAARRGRAGDAGSAGRDPGSAGALAKNPGAPAAAGAERSRREPDEAEGSSGERADARVIPRIGQGRSWGGHGSRGPGRGGGAGAGGIGGIAGGVTLGGTEPGGDHGPKGDKPAEQVGAQAAPDGATALPGIVFASEEGKAYPTTDPVDIPDSKDIPRDAGAVNFWLEPGWEGDSQDDADFIDLGDGGLRVVKNVNFLRFEYIDANGVDGGVGVEISDWKPGEARQVTATWDNGFINLYVDGKLVSQRPNPGLQRSDEPAPVVVGSVYPPDRPIAPGVLTDVQLFNRPLDPGEITSLTLNRSKK